MAQDRVPCGEVPTSLEPRYQPEFGEMATRYLEITLPARRAAIAANLERVRRRLAELRALRESRGG